MGADEERLKGVVVGNPVDRNGKIFFEVIAFDSDGPLRFRDAFQSLNLCARHSLQDLEVFTSQNFPKVVSLTIQRTLNFCRSVVST